MRAPRFLVRLSLFALPMLTAGACAPNPPPENPRFLPPGEPLRVSYTAVFARCDLNVDPERQVLTAAEDTLRFGDVRLYVPANAVREGQSVPITVRRAADVEDAPPEAWFRIEAEGQENFEFLKPATLIVSYRACGIQNAEMIPFHVIWLGDDPWIGRRRRVDHGGINHRDGTVRALITHLSDYALGAPQ